jgi:hypothetical protein
MIALTGEQRKSILTDYRQIWLNACDDIHEKFRPHRSPYQSQEDIF